MTAVTKTHDADFLKSLGNDAAKAWAGKKDQPVKLDAGGNLPAGIEGGQAKLTSAKIGKYESGDNVGKFYIRLAGVILAPQTVDVNGVPVRVAGKQTSQMLRMFPEVVNGKDGKRTITMEDRMDVLVNELKKLAMDPADPKKPVALPNTLPEVVTFLKALEKKGPVFGFRTWAGAKSEKYPNPRVNEVWQGTVPADKIAAEEDDGVVGDDVPTEVDDTPVPDDAVAAEQDGGDTSGGDVDWAATGESADAGDEDSKKLIQDRALEAGWSEDDINNAASWVEIVQALEGAAGDGEVDYAGLGEAADSADDDAIAKLTELAEAAGFDVNSVDTWGEVAAALAEQSAPAEASPYEVGNVVKFKPIDPKTKKPALKAVDCEIVKVNDDYTVVTLKNLATKVQYPNIAVAKLEA